MHDSGTAMMGIGEGEGENRAITAARAAISSPLLGLSVSKAKGILYNIIGGPDLGMYEFDEASRVIKECASEDAIIIAGNAISDEMMGKIKISVIATGFPDTTMSFGYAPQPYIPPTTSTSAPPTSAAPVIARPKVTLPHFTNQGQVAPSAPTGETEPPVREEPANLGPVAKAPETFVQPNLNVNKPSPPIAMRPIYDPAPIAHQIEVEQTNINSEPNPSNTATTLVSPDDDDDPYALPAYLRSR
jgi:cell division protein FtsZ